MSSLTGGLKDRLGVIGPLLGTVMQPFSCVNFPMYLLLDSHTVNISVIKLAWITKCFSSLSLVWIYCTLCSRRENIRVQVN